MRKIYIDFDGTLFNNNKFISDCIKILDKYSIDKDIVIRNLNIKNKIRDFRIVLKDISKEYNIDEKKLLNNYKKILNNDYLYDDAIEFLKELKNKYELILLTYGNNDYQLDKIKSTKIMKYFKNIIITQNNKNELDIDYTNSIFIDDNPDVLRGLMNKNCYKIIRLKRGKYKDINLEEINTFDNLRSIYEYLLYKKVE